MHLGKKIIIPMIYDLMFKYIFGRPENIKITQSLVEKILHLKKGSLDGLTIDNSVVLFPETIKQKCYETDVVLKTKEGIYINLEAYTRFGITARNKSFAYSSRISSNQLASGKPYSEMKKVIQINFVMNVSSSSIEFCERYSLFNQDNTQKKFTDLADYYIINLDKIPEDKYNDYRWLTLMKETNYEKMLGIAKGDEEMLEAIAEAVKFSGNEDIKNFYNRELFQKDEINVARKEGIQEGEKKGIKKGEKNGIKKTRIELVKNMINDNMPKEMIAKYTKLSSKEIDKIIKQN